MMKEQPGVSPGEPQILPDPALVQTLHFRAAETDTILDLDRYLAEAPPDVLLIGGGKGYDLIKRMLDFTAAAILFILTAPLALICGILVRLTSKGPAVYSQVRLGRGGKPFVLYKLRSMTYNCEKESGIRWCTKNDSRVTAFGRFLRKSHLDELPQLWNVLRGEMSLIGPRPERPELVSSLEKVLPDYRDRLLVLPGVTGLAQIQLPADTDLESVRRKLAVDRLYVEKRSLWLDLRIFLGTILYFFGWSVPSVQRKMRLPLPQWIIELQRRKPDPSAKRGTGGAGAGRPDSRPPATRSRDSRPQGKRVDSGQHAVAKH